MKFIKQDKNSNNVINLKQCETIGKSDLTNDALPEKPFSIKFEFKDTFEAWYYKKESDRDLQFIYICELVNVQTIGDGY